MGEHDQDLRRENEALRRRIEQLELARGGEEALGGAGEAGFRAMANSMSQLAWIASGDGYIYWYNQRWYEYTGTAPAQMEGWGWSSVHDPAVLPEVMQQWSFSIAAGEPFDMRFPLRGADGEFRDFLTRAVPLKDDNGKVVQWFGTNTDVHALTRVEASLRQSERRLTAAQRIASLGSWEWDVASGRCDWSEQTYRLFGIRNGEFAGTYEAFLSAVHPADRQRTHQTLQRALAGDAPCHIEHRVIWPDGAVHVLYEHWEVARDAAGCTVQVAGTVLDITERKEAEASLAETNRALRLLSRCNEAVVRSEHEGELAAKVCRIAVHEGGFQFAWVGYAPDDQGTIPAAAWAGSADDEAIARFNADAQGPAHEAMRSGQLVRYPDPRAAHVGLPQPDGGWVSPHGVVCLPLKQAQESFGVLVLYLAEARLLTAGELGGLQDLAAALAFGIVNLRSQSERRRLQAALQTVATSISASTGAQFFEQLVTSMVEAVGAYAGCVARLLPGQPPVARTLGAVVAGASLSSFDYLLQGTPCEELLRTHEMVVSSGGDELYSDPRMLELLGRPQAYVGRRLDDAAGKLVGFAVVLFAEPLRSTQFVCSTLQIFATRAEVELARQKSDAQVREHASLLDKAQDAILVRDLAHRVVYWNKSAERRYGWTADEALGRSVKELLYADYTAFDAATAATLERGEWVGELSQRRKDGTWLQVEGRWTLVHDDDGAPKSILAVNTDLTERKKLERTEEHLRQAQKMDAIGSLAGGVAHDFNNVLSVILSFAQLILDGLQPSDPLREDLEEIRKAGLRATELTRQLLAFSRKQILQPVVLDLNQIVLSVEKMLRRVVGEHIELRLATS
ncbi:MAG TPA: PAS domain-containing protein, partial [Polyangiaceae bacterium]|nr:PAS domain-containing protein [Polyangiaceae bacterium]